MSLTCMVLDIDQTLLYSTGVKKPYFKKVILPNNKYVYSRIRPHTRDFLKKLPKLYDIIIVWSAGEYNYVHTMVKYLFRDVGYYPSIILTRNDCDRVAQGSMYKPLYKVLAHPDLADAGLTMDDITILDDNAYTFAVNDRNGILAEQYWGDSKDSYLPSLIKDLRK